MMDSLRVATINVAGSRRAMAGWRGGRATNPLEPSYDYDSRTIRADELLGRTKPAVQGSNNSLRTDDIAGARPTSDGWRPWAKMGDKPRRTTTMGDIAGAQPGGLRKRPGADQAAALTGQEARVESAGTRRQSRSARPDVHRLDGTRPASRDHYRDPTVPAFPYGGIKQQQPKPSRLPPMEGDVFPKMLRPRPSHRRNGLDAKAQARHERRVLDQVREKVEAKSKNITKVFRQFDENKDGDISYDEFRLGLRHLGIQLSDDDYNVLVKKVDVDGEGTVDYNEFAEVLKAPDMQLSFMPTEAPFAGTADVSSMKTDLTVKRDGVFDGSKRKQMGLAVLPKDDILRQIAEKVRALRPTCGAPPPSLTCRLPRSSRDQERPQSVSRFDEDKSGSVDVVEFRRGLAHLGLKCPTTRCDRRRKRLCGGCRANHGSLSLSTVRTAALARRPRRRRRYQLQRVRGAAQGPGPANRRNWRNRRLRLGG